MSCGFNSLSDFSVVLFLIDQEDIKGICLVLVFYSKDDVGYRVREQIVGMNCPVDQSPIFKRLQLLKIGVRGFHEIYGFYKGRGMVCVTAPNFVRVALIYFFRNKFDSFAGQIFNPDIIKIRINGYPGDIRFIALVGLLANIFTADS